MARRCCVDDVLAFMPPTLALYLAQVQRLLIANATVTVALHHISYIASLAEPFFRIHLHFMGQSPNT